MSSDVIEQGSSDAQDKSLVRGGLGFLAGLVVCGVAMAAQAAILHAVASSAKRAS